MGSSVEAAIQRFEVVILQPFIYLLAAAGLAVFIWGAAQMIISRASGDSGSFSTGQKHLVWGIIGLTITFTAYALSDVVCNTVKLFGSATNC
ncbi:MAG: hypothetical protein Q8Q18_00905 [bacterium]|nr:hypothetical protein [bacterium]